MRRSVLALGASVVLTGVAGVLLYAQEPKADKKKDEAKPAAPAPAPPPPQDKVEMPAMIDSWYKVLHGDAPLGHIHETLQKSGPAPIRYQYSVLTEVEIEVPDPQVAGRTVPSTESLMIDARLDDTYAPIDMTWSFKKDAAELVGKVFQTDAGRRIEIHVPDSTPTRFPVRDMDLHYTAHLMFVTLRQNDQLSTTGLKNAKVFFPRVNEAPVADVSFEVRDWVQREYLGKKVPVTRIDWVKPLPAPSRELEIVETYVDKFGRVVEEVTREGKLRMVLVKGEEEAVGQSALIQLRGRRDPFRKDLAMRTKTAEKDIDKVKGTDGAPPPATPEEGLAAADKIIEELVKAKERKDLDGARSQYYKGIKLFLQLRDLKEPNPEARNRIEEFKKKLEDLFGGAKRRLEEARGVFVRGVDRFGLEDVAGVEKALGDLRKMEGLPEFVGAGELTELKTWIADLEPMLVRCRTRLELAKKKLVLTGVTLCYDEKPQVMEFPLHVFGHSVGAPHELRFIRAAHYAIINEKMVRVGDLVEGEGVRVEKIWKYGVQVSLKEETREVPIRQ